jgi:hypothetical protein
MLVKQHGRCEPELPGSKQAVWPQRKVRRHKSYSAGEATENDNGENCNKSGKNLHGIYMLPLAGTFAEASL